MARAVKSYAVLNDTASRLVVFDYLDGALKNTVLGCSRLHIENTPQLAYDVICVTAPPPLDDPTDIKHEDVGDVFALLGV